MLSPEPRGGHEAAGFSRCSGWCGGSVAARGARAAAERMRRIGVLMHTTSDEPDAQAQMAAFLQGLQVAGWEVGRNLRIETRWSGGDPARLRKNAADLVALNPDVIMAGSGPTLPAMLQATRTVPIVFAQSIDPIGSGSIRSLAQPGGNATGFLQFEYDLAGKWLELLKEIAPLVKRVGVLRETDTTRLAGQWAVIQAFSRAAGVELSPLDVRNAADIERSATAFASVPNGGLIVAVTSAALNSSRADRRARGAISLARRLSLSLLRHRRRPDLLRARSGRPVPPRGRLRRSHPQGREAGRPAGAGADQVRAGHQPQDRQGARHRLSRRRCSPAPTR